MDGIGFIIIGIVTALNFLFIKKKFDLKRYEDAIFDLLLLVVILFIFSGSYGALVVGMVASLIISISFYASPPKFITPFVTKLRSELQEANRKSPIFPDWDGGIR